VECLFTLREGRRGMRIDPQGTHQSPDSPHSRMFTERYTPMLCSRRMEIDPLARALNETLTREAPTVFALLSERGKRLFFPVEGILGQTSEAKGSAMNATIGIGFDDVGAPLALPSLLKSFNLPPEDVLPYAPSFGLPQLRERWGAMLREKNSSLSVRLSLPVVTAGITHALDVAAALFVDPNDSVILPDPAWDNYALTFSSLYGASLSSYPAFRGAQYNLAALEETIARSPGSKKIVLLNFPHNPSGYTLTVKEAQDLAQLLRRRAESGDTLLVLLDDAYFGLVYEEGILRESLLSILSNLHERILIAKIDGASKEDCAWGLRIGFLTFAQRGMTDAVATALEHKAAGAVRASVSNACRASQAALLSLYNSPSYDAEKVRTFSLLHERYREVRRALTDSEIANALQFLPFNSGYFFCVALPTWCNADVVRRALLRDHSIGVIAMGNLLRIAYSSLPRKHIEPVLQTIAQVCRSQNPPENR